MRVATGDALNQLVEEAYAAALTDGWATWSERLIAALGGSGGSFLVADAATGRIHNAVLHAPVSRAADEYAAGFHALDPQMAYGRRIAAPSIYRDTDYLDLSDPNTREYTAWLRGSIGLDHHMSIVAPLGAGSDRAAVSIIRGMADGHTPDVERDRFAAIGPDIVRALQLGFRHAALLQASFWEGACAGKADPAVLVAGDGRIIRVSAAADALFAIRDGVHVAGQRLRCFEPSDEQAAAAMIARAIATPARSSAARVRRRSGRSAFVLVAYPLPRSRRMLAPAEAAALVTIVDPLASAAQGPLYRDAFELTPREAQLAELLMLGHSPESAGAVMAIATPTIRIHLRRVLAKTGTSRQAELVQLLSRLA